ncbi:V-type ATP synthase subunit E [Athalassotoga saccharophila]|uniref:V-type ATP synthase subunit E n=1 Tax=Athalassotoga saccharophila TaxID=1441386 RepID=UPI00137ADE38|nr:V-type ATP synthase subunit E family protein [Athalassotoga saccharophila]BBJ28347.1 V-type ATP synthase subunit E [Athalassotoga saccharophila]
MNVEKKVEALKSYVKNKAEEDADSILKEAQKKADEIKKEYEARATEEYNRIIESAKKQIKEMERTELSQAESKVSRILIEGQKDIMEDAMNLLKEKIFELPQSAAYHDLLYKFLEDAINVLDSKDVIVKVRKEDKALVSKMVAKFPNLNITISDEEAKIAGGVVVLSKDGKSIVENSLENKVEELREECLSELFAKLKVR